MARLAAAGDTLKALDALIPDGAHFTQDWDGATVDLWFGHSQRAVAETVIAALADRRKLRAGSDRIAETHAGTCNGAPVRVHIVAASLLALTEDVAA